MKHYGDITKIHGKDVPVVDIITGGSPCQDLSVAGKRAGLQGERSGLFMEQIRIIKEMRESDRADKGSDVDIRPRYMVWENVPGAFSSNKGEDFRAVLEETAKIGCESASIPRPEGGKWNKAGCIMGDGWSIAWRLHDAQYWGVPQRRKRICLLADFNGDTAPKILFELQPVSNDGNTCEAVMDLREESKPKVQPVTQGMSGNTQQGTEEREGTTSDAERSLGDASYTLKMRGGADRDSTGRKAGKGALIQTELSATLGVSQDQTLITNRGGGGESYVAVSIDEKMGNTYVNEEMGNTLGVRDYKQPQAVLTYGLDRASFNQGKNAQYDFSIKEDMAQTLVSKGPGGGCNEAVGALCARDYKGVGNQYVQEGKLIVQRGRPSNSKD